MMTETQAREFLAINNLSLVDLIGHLQTVRQERDEALASINRQMNKNLEMQALLDGRLEENEKLTAQNARLRAALEKYSTLDEQVSKCTDDDVNGHECQMAPESCGYCFPFADDARIAMRTALAETPAESLTAVTAPLQARNARLRAEMEDLAEHFEAMSHSDQGDAVTWSCAATTIRESLAEIEAETPTESLEAVLAPHGLLREKVRAIKHLIPEPYRAEIGKLLADSWDACDALDTLRAEAGREAIGKKTWEIENGTSYHPENCPVTGRPFFMTIEDESGKMVATYGGPFDSYTIPEWNAEDDEFRSERYDHDAGAWVDGGEPYEIILRDEQEWLRLKTLEDEQTAIRKKAGRERAVRELEALMENPLLDSAARNWMLKRREEIAKEGK